jgi:hypothetical protein
MKRPANPTENESTYDHMRGWRVKGKENQKLFVGCEVLKNTVTK